MLNLFGTGKTEKDKSHLGNLIAVAMSDGTLDESEWQQIVKIARSRGIDDATIEKFREESHSAVFRPPASFRMKVEQIYDLLEIMLADGKVEAPEMETCRKLAERYNLHPRIIRDMLVRMTGLIHEGKSTRLVIDEITEASN